MGRYINFIEGTHIGTSFEDKCKSIEGAGGIRIDVPEEFVPNLVCVVDNGFFGAAAHAYDAREMEHFKHPDTRPMRWYILDGASDYAE